MSNSNDQDDKWLKKIHHDDRDRINQAFEKFLADKSITFFQLEYWVNGWDRFCFIRDKVKVERGDDITKDITDRKRAENKLRYSEANLAATINNTKTYKILFGNVTSSHYLRN